MDQLHKLADSARHSVALLATTFETSSIHALLATLVFCCIAGVWTWMMILRRRRMPPGPRGLPIIGHLHLLGALPHQALAHLSKTYGPLMCVRFGVVPVLIASTPDMAMLFLQTHDKTFAGSPTNISTANIIYPCPDILYSQPGPYWKLMRQICTADFFSNKRLDHFRPVRAHEMRALLLSILSAQGSPLSIREKLHRTTSNVISTMVLGKPLHEFVSADSKSLNLVSIVVEVLRLLGASNLGDYIPCLAWMDLQGYEKQSKIIAGKLTSMLQDVIDRRRRSSGHESGNDPPHDFLDLLLLASVNAKHKELQIDDASIRSVLLDMFGAGTDTSTVTSEWALAELLTNPEKLRRVQEELDEKVGRLRMIEEGDFANLPYMRAVVSETLRLHPTAPLLAPHKALEECKIAGYEIPANTAVYINIWAIQRDPSVWESPLEFRPERFLNTKYSDPIPGQHMEYLPFGAGRRSCPGWKLGLVNVQNILANLLHAFDLATPGGIPPPLNERPGMSVALEDPLMVVATPRLPRSLFDASL